MKTTTLRLVVLVLTPLLGAPLCKSVHPNWPTNPAPSMDFRTNEQYVEPKMVEASANSVLALGPLVSNWSTVVPGDPKTYIGVEPCNKCAGTNCSATPWPAGWPTDDQHAETYGSQTWRCSFNFQNLGAYLDTHSDPNGPRVDPRNVMIQLAPLFYQSATYPPYLYGFAFDSPTFENKFHRLWDNILPIIQQHHDNRIVIVSLGNEVNNYLNLNNPSITWPAYTDFVQDAVNYIHSTTDSTIQTVTMSWYAGCGIGDYLWTNPNCNYQQQLDLMSLTDEHTYTYYPPRTLTTPELQTRISNDFFWMSYASDSYQKKVLIQEAGYPTSGNPPPSSTQTVFVNQVFAESANYTDYILWLNYFATYDFPPTVFMPTGFFFDTGTVKSQANWDNFKTQMANAQ